MKLLRNNIDTIVSSSAYLIGLQHFKNKKWENALKFFKSAVSARSDHPDSNFKLGLCHMKLGDFDESFYYIKKALELAPENVQWYEQLEQCERHIKNSTSLDSLHSHSRTGNSISISLPRIQQGNTNQTLGKIFKKKILLVPSDYNPRVLSDILPFVNFYKDDFEIFIILRDIQQDIIVKVNYTLVKNGSSYGEFLKFTSDYVIDAGTLNYGHRITDTNKWVSVWHGIPYKKMFVDLDMKHLSTAIRYNIAYDTMISMSDYYTETFLRKSLRYDGEILQLGSAKIDKLFEVNDSQYNIKFVKEKYKIPVDKKVILYMPFFRGSGKINIPFTPQKLIDAWGDKYILVIAIDENNVTSDNFEDNRVKIISQISSADALLMSSALISDYHPIIKSFNEYGKPVVLFHHDYELFIKSHPEIREEAEELAKYPYVITRETYLYSYNWQSIENQLEVEILPDSLNSAQLAKYNLDIPTDKKIILYAPTYRITGVVDLPFDPDQLISYLNENFKDDYIIITKMHYLNSLSKIYENVIDCTKYSELVDLMKISDILISDYSSLILDFALLNKPIILFQYDYYRYTKERGVYFNFEDYLPSKQIIDREMDLYTLDWENLSEKNEGMIEKFYPVEDGKSTKRIVNALNFDSCHRKCKDIIFLVNDLNQIGGVHSFIKNMAKYYKESYNARIFVIAINEFAESNSEYHLLESPFIDFKLTSQYLKGACTSILQNTDGIVISLQFSAHLHFQKYLTNSKAVLMFHGDVKDMISKELYGPHLEWLNKGKLYNYEKLILLTQSAVDLLNPYLIDSVQEKLGYIHNSVENLYSPLPPSLSKSTAVISRLDIDKNVMVLIDLGNYIKATRQDINVNVYGDGALKSELSQAIEDNDLGDILRLRGFENDKYKIFSENDSLLLLSKSEGLPIVILEAYAYGKPAIVFDTFTAAKEVVKHGETGFLIPYGDLQGVVNGINKIGDISSDSIRLLFNEFDNQHVFKHWNALFTELDSSNHKMIRD